MTAPKPKPLGSTIEVPDGTAVVRPGDDSAMEHRITGGVYVFDVPGEHVVGGKTILVSDDPESSTDA